MKGDTAIIERRYVYEAVDYTDDEVYYVIGLWEKLEDAVAAIESADPSEIDEYGQREFGEFKVRIRRRRLNAVQLAHEYVHVVEFSQLYDEETDEYLWKVTRSSEWVHGNDW